MSEGDGIALLKLGGSLITDKSGVRSLRRGRLERIAAEIASALARGAPALVIGHGSGSFGHVEAARSGVGEGTGAAGVAGIVRTQAAAAELHAHVLGALRRAGVAAYSIAPSSCIVTERGRPVSVAIAPLARALEAGLVPVTYGDVVMDRARGVAIASTETVLLAFARRLRRRGVRPRVAYWLGDTDGVLGSDGRTLARLRGTDLRAVLGAVGGSAATDVTGGMRHRLVTAGALARIGVTSWILDGRPRGAAERALGGQPGGGTRVVP